MKAVQKKNLYIYTSNMLFASHTGFEVTKQVTAETSA
jgi:hypothetical protein